MTVTVFQQFELAALTAPELPFLIYPKTPDREYIPNGQIFSYFDALCKVNSLSEEYIKSGYRAGHRVALLFGNRPEHFWHFLALNKIGASIVPLNPTYLEHELEYAIDFSECSLLSTAGEGNEDTVGVCSRLNPPIPVHNTSLDDPKIPAPGRMPNISPKDPVMANLCSQTELQAAIDKAKRRQEKEAKKKEREAKKAAKAAASTEVQN